VVAVRNIKVGIIPLQNFFFDIGLAGEEGGKLINIFGDVDWTKVVSVVNPVRENIEKFGGRSKKSECLKVYLLLGFDRNEFEYYIQDMVYANELNLEQNDLDYDDPYLVFLLTGGSTGDPLKDFIHTFLARGDSMLGDIFDAFRDVHHDADFSALLQALDECVAESVVGKVKIEGKIFYTAVVT